MCFVQMTARDGKLTENKTKNEQKIAGDDIVSCEKNTLDASAAGSNSQKRK